MNNDVPFWRLKPKDKTKSGNHQSKSKYASILNGAVVVALVIITIAVVAFIAIAATGGINKSRDNTPATNQNITEDCYSSKAGYVCEGSANEPPDDVRDGTD
jgi:hypothetical protein